jgi:hypothetical protein
MFQSEGESRGNNDSFYSSQIEETPTLTPKNMQFAQKAMQEIDFSL